MRNSYVYTPILDRGSVAETYDVSGTTASTALDLLTELEILELRPLRKARRGRPGHVYEAMHIFDLLDTAPSEI